MNPKLPLLLCLLAALAYYWSTRTGAPATPKVTSVTATNQSAAPDELVAVTTDSTIEANSLVAEAADAMLRGASLHAKARFSIDLMGQKFSAPGEYWQQGQGSRKTRLEFSYQQDDQRLHVFQVCDGRCFYWYRTLNSSAHLEYVDLQAIEDIDDDDATFLAGRQAWNSVGGLSSMLDHLAKAFHFEAVRRAELDGMPVFLIRGRWKTESLTRLMEGQVEPDKLAADDWWRYLPEHLPHEVRLTFGADEPFRLFPYRVEFLQYRVEGKSIECLPIVSLELYEVERRSDIPETLFRVAAVRCEPVDLTQFYLDRVQQFTRR
jgi:hypothetical protein